MGAGGRLSNFPSAGALTNLTARLPCTGARPAPQAEQGFFKQHQRDQTRQRSEQERENRRAEFLARGREKDAEIRERKADLEEMQRLRAEEQRHRAEYVHLQASAG